MIAAVKIELFFTFMNCRKYKNALRVLKVFQGFSVVMWVSWEGVLQCLNYVAFLLQGRFYLELQLFQMPSSVTSNCRDNFIREMHERVPVR